jgi:hypothetical protein
MALINMILKVYCVQGTHPHANCIEPNELGKLTDISSLAAKFDVVRVVDGTWPFACCRFNGIHSKCGSLLLLFASCALLWLRVYPTT